MGFEDWVEVPLVDFVRSARQREFFAEDCRAFCPRNNLELMGEVEIYRIGQQSRIEDVIVCLGGKSLKGRIGLGRSGSRIFFSPDSVCQVDIRSWRTAYFFVGPAATINNARIVLDDAQVYIGHDAMLSDEILIQAGDQHSIWNLDLISVSNADQAPIIVGEHAWIGRRATLLPGAQVGCGAIVGTASVVTGEIPPFGLAVGVPARIIRERVTWSRNIAWFSPSERDFLVRRAGVAKADLAGSARNAL
jgi:acetyltransferase-like isoleucine patch superfamily enzyme